MLSFRARIKKICDRAGDDKLLTENYAIETFIGEGRFSQVFKAVSLRGYRSKVFALKRIVIQTLEEDTEAISQLESEVRCLRRVAGTMHVARLHELLFLPATAVFLVMEHVPGAELFELLQQFGALDAVYVRCLTRQLFTALSALAELGVVHRDVKPENVMITEASDAEPHLTLIDFGYAALCDDAAGGRTPSGGLCLSGLAGSPEYAAPEVLSWLDVGSDGTSAVGERYGARCDVYSAGVTAHVLLCGELPFQIPSRRDEASLAMAARQPRLTFRHRIWRRPGMDDAKAFVCACMVADQLARPSAQALLSHSWLHPVDAPIVREARAAEATSTAAAVWRALNRSLGMTLHGATLATLAAGGLACGCRSR
jgi:serine/threonine protein kinase